VLCDVQARAERLTADHHFLIVAEGVFEFGMLRFDQERTFVLVCRIEQFQVKALVGAVSRGHRP